MTPYTQGNHHGGLDTGKSTIPGHYNDNTAKVASVRAAVYVCQQIVMSSLSTQRLCALQRRLSGYAAYVLALPKTLWCFKGVPIGCGLREIQY